MNYSIFNDSKKGTYKYNDELIDILYDNILEKDLSKNKIKFKTLTKYNYLDDFYNLLLSCNILNYKNSEQNKEFIKNVILH